jgi:hypothetical protein
VTLDKGRLDNQEPEQIEAHVLWLGRMIETPARIPLS